MRSAIMVTCTSLFQRVLPISVIAGGALLLVAGCQQPKINCMAAHGDFAAVYTLKSGDASSPCGQLAGDLLGMQTYAQEGGKNGTPNYSDSVVAIRPAATGELVIRALGEQEAGGVGLSSDEWYAANAIGGFSAGLPDDNDFCEIPELDSAVLTLPLLPSVEPTDDDPMTDDVDESDPGLPEIPANTISYTWKNARWLVSADAQGTQFEADLTYSENGCSAEYSVLGLYPAIGCETDEECNQDDNGINPDFAVRCEASIGLCVIADALPSYE